MHRTPAEGEEAADSSLGRAVTLLTNSELSMGTSALVSQAIAH